MSVIKVKGLTEKFTIVPNKTIDDDLSWSALGMLMYLGSKSEDWEVCITDLVRKTKNASLDGKSRSSGRDAVRKNMNELIERGYMRKVQSRIKGKFGNVDHEVSLEPLPDSPSTEKPFTAKPSTANPTQPSTEYNQVRNKPSTHSNVPAKAATKKKVNQWEIDYPTELNLEVWKTWLEYRKEIRKPFKSGNWKW